MRPQRRLVRLAQVLLAQTLALATVAIAPPARAQGTPPAAPSGSAAGGAAVPNLSGMWAHPYLTGFEPPVSGPGPILNRSRRPDGVANFQLLVGDYTNPILKPEAAEIVKKHGEISLSGGGYPTPSNQCWPQGVPYVFWDFIVQLIQEPHQVTLIYRHGNEVRHVRMNAQHSAQVTPSWYGDSVGHYEGDTLVIDTVGMRVGPYSMVDMYGTPQSPALHVVERYRLLDFEDAKELLARNDRENIRAGGGAEIDPKDRGKVLQLQFTVEDPNVFTMPWTALITYRRNVGEWTELICAENPREANNREETSLPVATKPDF